ncbi:hypothetical protein BH23CHL5_BH23CHL5_03920 [soil metagenome]
MSFAGPGHCLKIITAACSRDPSSHQELLNNVREYDERFADRVLDDLAIFDEFVAPDRLKSIERWIQSQAATDQPTFRIYNQHLRNMSLNAETLGIVLFNLVERRIVQIQNAYGELLRADRGRIRVDGRPVKRYYHYALPDEWALLP